jgi:hypothetical protein
MASTFSGNPLNVFGVNAESVHTFFGFVINFLFCRNNLNSRAMLGLFPAMD